MIGRLLIANRGEIAVRIARTAAELGVGTTVVYAEDDAKALPVSFADHAVGLGASGPEAYLDGARIVAIGREAGCEAVHPGYGFLSENPGFAQACVDAGLIFVGPDAATLAELGDKARARDLAQRVGAPVLRGTAHVDLEAGRRFFEALGPGAAVMVKAAAGGGGRGMRLVRRGEDFDEAFARCASEAQGAFGSGALYVEEFLPRARHVEVQIVGDGTGEVVHLWDRECSLQRARQKLVEIAPAIALDDTVRHEMREAALRIGRAVAYRGLGTVEFLVDAGPKSGSKSGPDAGGRFVFLEVNPRLQVEHTVTEEVTGLDLVALQLRIASGATLADLGLAAGPPPVRGVAVQARVNLETVAADGTVRPGGGRLTTYDPPSGPGVRVDGYGYVGYETSSRYDSLLAKVIGRADSLEAAVNRTRRALGEFRIAGARTNIPLLTSLLAGPAITGGELHTRYVEDNLPALIADADAQARQAPSPSAAPALAGAQVDPNDPLAVLNVKPSAPADEDEAENFEAPFEGAVVVRAPLQGLIIRLAAAEGDRVRRGQPLAVMEALKMEHVLSAETSGVVRNVLRRTGDVVFESTPLLVLEALEIEDGEAAAVEAADLDAVRDDLAEILEAHRLTSDAGRPEAVARRRIAGKRTARENIEDLCDPGSFLEYGPLVTAGRLRSDTPDDLGTRLVKTAADGMVMGVGRVNGELFGPERARCVALSYDYTVLAGTQGAKNHQKTDRMLGVAHQSRLPVVLFSEGGGGRTSMGVGLKAPAGETWATSVGALNTRTWREMGKLSGLVPLVGINSGYCFAGNVVLLGACDVIIATRDSSLGIGGPAVIEGGGLGVYAAADVGPVRIQQPNGVIDILVEDEAEAVQTAKRYLSYFQGAVATWSAPDQRPLRGLVPVNRKAVYDIRKVIDTLADTGSVLELRPRFGRAMVTALVRVEGRPMGVIANNCASPTGGAIDADAADKASRFMQLCDAFDLPVLSLIDTPGNMVGPEAEKTALIRHCARMYVAGANLTVPLFAVVLRKAYGLGALAMSTGSLDETFFSVSWPTGEFAGMGLEGAVKLGRRAELAAITDIPARKARYDELVREAYAWSRALNAATVFEVDDVIDPAETRRWIVMGLESAPKPPPRAGKKRAWIDTW